MASWLEKIRHTPVTVTFAILFFLVLGSIQLLEATVRSITIQLSSIRLDDSVLVFQLQMQQLLKTLMAVVQLSIGGGLLARKRCAQNLGIIYCVLSTVILIATSLSLFTKICGNLKRL